MAQSATVVTRFAPSPTGRLHLGHAFSALQSHDRARAEGGAFLLRIEDIDGTRSRPEYIQGILDDLRWLGLDWDGAVLAQSTRLDAYQAALDTLAARGLLYRCYCTRAEIAQRLSAPHGPPGALYPGTCRGNDRLPRSGEQHAWRIDMAKAATLAGPLDWHDEIAGPRRADPLAHGDVVLARKDAPASYHLAVSVDDAFQRVTHVVRGADLIGATDVHVLLQPLLGLPTPVYRHHGLLRGPDGERLAKRNGAPALASLRDAGVDGRTLADDLRAGRLPIGFAPPSA